MKNLFQIKNYPVDGKHLQNKSIFVAKYRDDRHKIIQKLQILLIKN